MTFFKQNQKVVCQIIFYLSILRFLSYQLQVPVTCNFLIEIYKVTRKLSLKRSVFQLQTIFVLKLIFLNIKTNSVFVDINSTIYISIQCGILAFIVESSRQVTT